MKKITIIVIVLLVVFLCVFIYKHPFTSESVDDYKCDELFCRYYDDAEVILSTMSLEEKIGQLFFVRFDEGMVEEQINTYYPGGYVLFARDFTNHTKESISSLLQHLQEISKTPLAFAVDEEGGWVTRVSRYPAFRSSKFLSPQEVYANGGYDALESTEKEKGELLLSLGLNVNLAPVADVSVNPDDFIYSRTFGKDAKETATYVGKMVNYANEVGISSCLKHFPGYGNNSDTHTGSAIDNRSYESFVESDFLPFETGIKERNRAHSSIFCHQTNLLKLKTN